MKTATIRELRTHFPRWEAFLFEGESIAITKRKRIVATLVPAGNTAKPDFRSRLNAAISISSSQEKELGQVVSRRTRFMTYCDSSFLEPIR